MVVGCKECVWERVRLGEAGAATAKSCADDRGDGGADVERGWWEKGHR